ncbi:YcdB/YcdC domain-containing protein [Desulfotomaculum copahuensis]|uniref:YcdB/YcdC repeated domain-containing protein n=1 Tax=Desulfotomaculum copahuensis TaxID=1838280 RepID=A0A1B7LGC2_9FIRM|nr:YcdB/YcdC domain-containing protein [Desulfotomaculum copahuensis]OAT85023.1 hypothetical protein A6M21_07315 [Desulfotomaculum copahuensis]
MRKAKEMAAAVLAAGMLLAAPAGAAEKPAPAVPEVQTVQATGEAVQLSSPGVDTKQNRTLTQSQKQALTKVCQAVPELKELTVQHVSDEGGKAWSVMLAERTPDSAARIQTVNAFLGFDRAGELQSFNINNPQWASDQVPASALAKEKAAQFVHAFLGEQEKEYQPGASIGYGGSGTADEKGNQITWASADVQYNRLINGIPLMNSGFRVNVDVFGHITGFQREKEAVLDPAKFPAPARAITPAAAEKAFSGLVEMNLQYYARHPLKLQVFNTARDETRPVLMYAPSFPAPIDALTGKPLADFMDHTGQPKWITLQGEGGQLTAGTPEEAAALLAKQFGIDMAGMRLQNVDERPAFFDPEIKTKEYNWVSQPEPGLGGRPENGPMRFLHMTTIAGTGRVVGFNLQDESGRGRQATVSPEAALNTAEQFLSKLLPPGTAELQVRVYPSGGEVMPSWVDKSKLQAQEQPQPVFSFNFNRIYQGVPVVDSGYAIQVDAITGKIIGFNDGFRGTSVALPDNKNVVSAETAKAEFLKQHPLQLVYIWPEFFGQRGPSPELVYIPAFGSGWDYIDAFTGKTVTVGN